MYDYSFLIMLLLGLPFLYLFFRLVKSVIDWLDRH